MKLMMMKKSRDDSLAIGLKRYCKPSPRNNDLNITPTSSPEDNGCSGNGNNSPGTMMVVPFDVRRVCPADYASTSAARMDISQTASSPLLYPTNSMSSGCDGSNNCYSSSLTVARSQSALALVSSPCQNQNDLLIRTGVEFQIRVFGQAFYSPNNLLSIILPDMVGVGNLRDVVNQFVCKPYFNMANTYDKYKDLAKALNFLIVGPNGSGKRSAVKSICQSFNFSYFCVNPSKYQPGQIEAIVLRTKQPGVTPAIIYFDDFNTAILPPENGNYYYYNSGESTFVTEFKRCILADAAYTKGWIGAWIALGFTEPTIPALKLAAELCMIHKTVNNVAFMEQIEAETLVKLLRALFQKRHLDEPLDIEKTDKFEVLRRVLNDSMPGEVSQFADLVYSSVIRNIPFNTRDPRTLIDWERDVESLYEMVPANRTSSGEVEYQLPRKQMALASSTSGSRIYYTKESWNNFINNWDGR